MPNLRHAVLIAASADKIYDAITSSEGLSAWWTPNSTAKAELDSVVRLPFGPKYLNEMRITELIPGKRLKWHCLKGEDEWVGTNLSFDLQSGDQDKPLSSYHELEGQCQQIGDVSEVTLLVFQHEDWRAETLMSAECNYTWGQFLHSLKLFCETGKGQPWPDQHRPRS
jgi:uncharacterized protein YndB with AHSA1/START domain